MSGFDNMLEQRHDWMQEGGRPVCMLGAGVAAHHNLLPVSVWLFLGQPLGHFSGRRE